MKVVVVIPTYNEVENLKTLLPILADELRDIHHECAVLIVDGNSPDGTAAIAKQESVKYPFLTVLVEPKKEGIGAAYIRGFRYAIEKMGADVVMEMDADLQHDPRDIHRFITEIESGADLVIGSRYIKGGSIPKEWALYRKAFSIGASIVSKLILGIFDIHDFSTGFKAYRIKDMLDRVDFDSLITKSFGYKYEIIFQLKKLGAKSKEIPIKFGLRDRGSSKIEKDTIFDSFKVVLLIRYRESKSFFKFLVVGCTGFLTDSIIANLLRVTLLRSSYASLVSGLLAMVVTYLLNNYWSFSGRSGHLAYKERITSFGTYAILSYLPIVFRGWLISRSVSLLGDSLLVFNVTFIVGVIAGLIWNYTMYSKVIWRRK